MRNSYCNSGPGASAYNGNGASNSQGGPVQLIITGAPLNGDLWNPVHQLTMS